MFLGDNFLKRGIVPYAERFADDACQAQILLKPVLDSSAFGARRRGRRALRRAPGRKTREPVSDLAVVGVSFFGPEVHAIVSGLAPSARGELEITDAIQGLVAAGHTVRSATIDDDWVDTGKKDDMLEANRLVLMTIARRIAGDVDPASTIVHAA
jgi:glucose-1-phosphate thymidylyltransferase